MVKCICLNWKKDRKEKKSVLPDMTSYFALMSVLFTSNSSVSLYKVHVKTLQTKHILVFLWADFKLCLNVMTGQYEVFILM